MNAADLTPGTYRTSRDVAAISPDRRMRRDWRATAVKKGTIVHVRPFQLDDDRTVLELWAGEWPHQSIGVRDAAELIAALEPVQDTPGLWMDREHNGYGARMILNQLVKDGVVTLDQVKAAYEHANDEEPAPAAD